MTLEKTLNFTPSLILRSGHIQTIMSGKRKVKKLTPYETEILNTPDDDFLTLNWSRSHGNKKNLAILCHGLEGHSYSSYILGMANAFSSIGWDSLSWDYRSCSRELNKTSQMYHAGATDDLDTVCKYVSDTTDYQKILLVGFSLGANLILLYGSEKRETLEDKIKGIISFSAPIDLGSSSKALTRLSSQFYSKILLKKMKEKVRRKALQFPKIYSLETLDKTLSLKDFDENFVAPIHGFKNAKDYWNKCSSLNYFSQMKIPTLIVNAKNDPFLGPECYLGSEFKKPSNFCFEAPRHGGHVGFFESISSSMTWSEKRAIAFAKEIN